MRILFPTDTPFNDGAYSLQAYELIKRLMLDGHEVIWFAWNYVGREITFRGIPVVGGIGARTMGEDLINVYAKRFDVDIIMTLKDPWIYRQEFMMQLSKPWIAICPVDTEPLSVALHNAVNFATAVIAVTRNGQQAFAYQGIQAYYAPHGIDTDLFKPGDKAAARKELGLPQDKFLALYVGTNQDTPPRKNLDNILLAWEAFRQKNPDSLLMLHTDMSGAMGGFNANILADFLGWNKNVFRASDQMDYITNGCKAEYMVKLYQAADVLVAPSMGEGFHMPSLEAQACGTPVIGCNFAAQREMVWAGWKIPTGGIQYGELQWTSIGGLRFKASQVAIVASLEQAYAKRDDAETHQIARDGAMHYNHDTIYQKHWKPVMTQIEALVKGAVIDETKAAAD